MSHHPLFTALSSNYFSFYDGGHREREILWRAYLRLIKHVNSIFKVSLGSICLIPSRSDSVTPCRSVSPTNGQKTL